MKLLLTFMLGFFSYAICNAQPCEKTFKDNLEVGSTLISCSANYTLEKLKDGTAVMKRYYTENKTITRLATYKSEQFKELHGLYEERWDDGTLVTSGMYSNNLKVGEWKERGNQKGVYKEGKRDGLWTTSNNNSAVIETVSYLDGQLHGSRIKYDSTGTAQLTESYELGQLIHTTADTAKEHTEQMPRFPGCEQLKLGREELQKCADKKLLEFIYRTIQYPNKAREQNIQGIALIQFTVNKEGIIEELNVLNGLSKEIKEEVLKLVKKMPKWQPGMQDGQPVRVRYTMPITFKLE